MTAKSSKSKTTLPSNISYDRQILLIGDVNEEAHHKLSLKLNSFINQSLDPILLVLDTPGGELHSGLGIYDAIKSSPAPIHILVRGRAMSMGMCVLQAGVSRLSTPNSMFMLHQIHYSLSSDRLEVHSEHVSVGRIMQRLLDGLLLERSHLTEETLARRMKAGDWYMTAEDALEQGLIDAIVQ